MKTTDIILNLIAAPVAGLGYELVDVEFKKEQNDWVLTIYINKEGGITIDDCELVSRTIEPIIDEADPIAQAYFLSVSSPGLDRPLKNEKDYLNHVGKKLIIRLYTKQDNKKEFIGELKSIEDGRLAVACQDGKERVFLLNTVALTKPFIEF